MAIMSGCTQPELIDNRELPALTVCEVPNPVVPSSAFDIFNSSPDERGDYWVEYQCKKICNDWQACLVPAYSDDGGTLIPDGRQPDQSKQALAFVIDGMGGHIALNNSGEKTVFIHTGAGGTRYYLKPADTLEKKSNARTIMVRWEKGYIADYFQPPFPGPISWGWFSRSSEPGTNLRELNKRVASLMDWSHENLAGEAMFGSLGCSMGTNATFGPVLWHGLDPVVDYQLFVGGPNMWDLNTQCARRPYDKGFCNLDATTACTRDSDCKRVGAEARCAIPGPYTTIDETFNYMPNHVHATDACDIRASDNATAPYPPFDLSSMAYATPADWQVDHKVDFLVNLGAKQTTSYKTGLGGDEYWAFGHFPYIYDRIKPDSNKQWQAIPNTHHCDAMFSEALDLIKIRMDL